MIKRRELWDGVKSLLNKSNILIKDKDNSEHYYWGRNCQGWRLIDENDFAVIEEEMPPHTYEKLHFHKYAKQLFYIIDGIAEFEVTDKKYKVYANQSFYIKPGLKHRIYNNTNKPLKFIVISQPSVKNDRFEQDK